MKGPNSFRMRKKLLWNVQTLSGMHKGVAYFWNLIEVKDLQISYVKRKPVNRNKTGSVFSKCKPG